MNAWKQLISRHEYKTNHTRCPNWDISDPLIPPFRTVHCTALHCTALQSTALHCTALHCTALHCTALHCMHCTAARHAELTRHFHHSATRTVSDRLHPELHCAALHCAALRCTALRCTALHCTALHCTALHWTPGI
jgi:hypothetical protein